MLACRPLRPKERTAFMAALFQDLIMCRDGELGRTLRDLWRQHFPAAEQRGSDLSRHGGGG
jgi:hypothetical protein